MAIFSLEGKGLKLTSADDVEPHIKALREMEDVEEVHLQGNTLGIEACKVIGDVLETKKSIKVSWTVLCEREHTEPPTKISSRSRTLRISSPVVYFQKYPQLLRPFSHLLLPYQIYTR